MITLTSLSKIYRTNEIETVALENVNLTVDRGEFLSIMGPSGCGKSTLLNIMELLHRLNKEDGRTIVMVTHNEEQAKQTSRTIRFFDGRQVQ